jgi:hypothetical protein
VAFSASVKVGFFETCAVCKSRVRRISRVPADRNVDVFEVLGLEFCGPMSVPSLGGRRYSLCAVDFHSRFMLHDVVRSKDEDHASFRYMLTTICSLGQTVRCLRVDNDTVFLSAAFRNLLDEFNIAVEITAPYAHWQHGRIERQWGHCSRWRSQCFGKSRCLNRIGLERRPLRCMSAIVCIMTEPAVYFSPWRPVDELILVPCGFSAVRPMPTLTSLNADILTIACGTVSLWVTLPSHRCGR